MNNDGKYILEVNNLNKTFSKEGGFSLEDISFKLPYGSIMGFVGENGAGKTTTIGCILGTLKKDSGTIQLLGREVVGNDIEVCVKEQIGVVYDAANFSGDLTPQRLSKVMNGVYYNWNDSIFLQYLENFHLAKNQRISTFSKGMLMKLAFAVAISHSPKLLILDEMTSGLDPIARDEILDVFLDFIQDEQRSIFMSSHITSDLEKVADYITFIDKGKILLSIPKDDLQDKYGIVRCKAKQFQQIEKNDIVSFIKKDYQVDVLISDTNYFRQKYNGYIIDNTTIEDTLLLLVKGERL